MRRLMAVLVAAMAVCISSFVAPVFGEVLYYDDFESYTTVDESGLISGPDGIGCPIIDGNGAWIASGGTYQWGIHNWPGFESATGYYLLRGYGLNSDAGLDCAVLRVHHDAGFSGLNIAFSYLLHINERAKIEISPDGLTWTDATSDFGLVLRESNSIEWSAAAELSAEAATAGIQDDLYVRFSAWNPTGNGNWHAFAIDNVSISVPEPSTVVLLGVGVIGLFAYARRRRAT